MLQDQDNKEVETVLVEVLAQALNLHEEQKAVEELQVLLIEIIPILLLAQEPLQERLPQ